jgi:hypothetical protein
MEVIVLLVALIDNAVVKVDAFRVGLDGFDRGGGQDHGGGVGRE